MPHASWQEHQHMIVFGALGLMNSRGVRQLKNILREQVCRIKDKVVALLEHHIAFAELVVTKNAHVAVIKPECFLVLDQHEHFANLFAAILFKSLFFYELLYTLVD